MFAENYFHKAYSLVISENSIAKVQYFYEVAKNEV